MNFDEKLEKILEEKCGLVRNKTQEKFKYSNLKFWKVIGGLDIKSLLDKEQAATMRFMLKIYPHLGEVREVFKTNPQCGMWLEEFEVAFISPDITEEVMLLVSPECNLYELTGYSDIVSLLESEFIPDLVKTIDENKCDVIDQLSINTSSSPWRSNWGEVYTYNGPYSTSDILYETSTCSSLLQPLQQGTTSVSYADVKKNFIVSKQDLSN